MIGRAFLAALVVLVTAAAAYADLNLIAGAACVRLDGTMTDVEYSNGRPRLTSSADATLICPVIRDLPTSDLVDAYVYVTDATTNGQKVSCTLECCTNAATSCDLDTASVATDGGGDQPIDFAAIDSENDGPCTISCTLKDTDDRLRWYRYEE